MDLDCTEDRAKESRSFPANVNPDPDPFYVNLLAPKESFEHSFKSCTYMGFYSQKFCSQDDGGGEGWGNEANLCSRQ